jgi:hypothetical protein
MVIKIKNFMGLLVPIRLKESNPIGTKATSGIIQHKGWEWFEFLQKRTPKTQ